jgi:MoaA/NifB/PqqE/SkfB family radical SAM enzyme
MTFDSEQISELLLSDNLHFRKIAFKIIIDDFNICSNLFFSILLSDCVEKDLIQYAYRRFPSLSGGYDKAGVFIPSNKYLYFSKYANEHALFLEKLKEYFCQETCIEKQRKLIINLSKYFEGLRSDLSYLFPQYKDTKNQPTGGNRQLMIFITGKCNLNCLYCFSNELEHSEISLTDLEEILEWAKLNQVAQISLCGGEPTLHNHFDEILLLIKKYRFKTYFASNFTIDCTSLQNFNENVIDMIYIHITDQTLENSHLRHQLLKNIEYAKKRKIELVCRTNIADKNPQIAKWFQFLQETTISTLNIALTFPTRKANNKYVDIHSIEQYYFVIEEIIRKSKEQNVNLSFAKPIPLCIFDEQTSSYLLASRNFHSLCSVNEQNCTRNLCVNIQKEFYACLGVTSSSLKFRKNRTWQELENFCTSIIQPLLMKPLWKKCLDCFFFDRKLCQGACLSYKTVL